MNEYIVVLVSVLFGAMGYLTATFWFQPILRYREVKSRVVADLIFYANVVNAQGLSESMKNRLEQRVEANRRHSADLVACFAYLPVWYQWWISRRDEDPVKAASNLMGLSNTFDYEPAAKRIEMIKRQLRIVTDAV